MPVRSNLHWKGRATAGPMARTISAHWLLHLHLAWRAIGLNGVTLAFEELDAITTVLALAAGELSEDELADWFRGHLAASAG